MGSNQFLLIVLSFIVMGVAIRVGVNLFQANNIDQNKNSLINDIQAITINALVYRTKTANLGGGKGSYVGYTVPNKLSSNKDGTFVISITANQITVTATSGAGNGTITAAFDQNGKYVANSLAYTGNFQ